ncbi:DUF726-domain-containing protein [Sporormia fimetaria CBS 119925]|uniref:DUF726-domain-containing protein n=1 Tax=Sporormia fimetaria CBS 119925 TaxID=1340428 RepID=A0A6A6VSF9_9PLEO|nr:DUF726-domain-containing protein [Sporormia fimetaria CBS 119925]
MVQYRVANVITGTASEAPRSDEGASLTTVLDTPALRVELALLVLLCADAMRADLAATFDAGKTNNDCMPTSGPNPPRPSPVNDLISFDAPRDEASMAADRERSLRQQEIGTTQMQALRRSALTFFDKWRAGVLNRLCEVLCLRGEVVRQAKTKRRQQAEEAERARQGSSLLIDLGSDPFSNTPSNATSTGRHGFYENVENKIRRLDQDKRVLVLHCLLLLLLSLEHYTAHSRMLLLRVAGSLGVGVDVLADHEKSVAQGLLATVASRMDAEGSAKKEAASNASSSRWKIGLAAVGGAVLIGVTGGLAAPLLAAGVGSVMGGLGLGAISGLLGTLAGSSVLIGSLFGAYGGKMTGKLMRQYAREVDDFEFIPIQDSDKPNAQQREQWADEENALDPSQREKHRLRVSIGVSGWLNSPSDVNKPWEVIDATGTEPFSLRFELDAMLRLGNSLNDVLFSYAWDGLTYTLVSRTLLGALYAGLWPLGLVKAASVLENPFSVAIARADKAGKVMARALMDKVQGERPVTLMGYSIGARVIYSCLLELADHHAFGLVESVVLMGTPVPSDTSSWRRIRAVVTGRVVNVHSKEDYILGFLYRSAKLQLGVAGLQEVQEVYGIENVDMSKTVNGHDKYRFLVGTILTQIGLGDIDFNKVADQERALEVSERKKDQVRKQAKEREHSGKSQEVQRAPATSASEDWFESLMDSAPPAQTRKAPTRGRHDPRSRTAQQPALQARKTMPQAAPAPLIDLLDDEPPPVRDPRRATAAIPTRTATFPVASRSIHKQSPSNVVPTPPAPPQQARGLRPSDSDNDSEEEHKISMVDMDKPDCAPLPKVSLDAVFASAPVKHDSKGKSVPSVTVQEVAVDGGAGEDCDSSDDEMNSQFGELSMVEPTPIDEEDDAWQNW